MVLAGLARRSKISRGAVEGAFVLAAVAGEAVELGDLVGEGGGFQGFDAAEVPAGGEELVEECRFKGAGGLDLGAVALFEFFERSFSSSRMKRRPVRLCR